MLPLVLPGMSLSFILCLILDSVVTAYVVSRRLIGIANAGLRSTCLALQRRRVERRSA